VKDVDDRQQEASPEEIPPYAGISVVFAAKTQPWRTRPAWTIGGIALVLLVGVLFLGRDMTKVANPVGSSPTVIGTAWQVEGVSGQTAPASPNGISFLQFDTNNAFSGRDTCGNSLQGTYRLAGNELTFSDVVSAYMACDQLVRWTPALRDTRSMLVEGSRLTLFSSDGAVTMELIRMNPVGSPTQVRGTSTRSPLPGESVPGSSRMASDNSSATGT